MGGFPIKNPLFAKSFPNLKLFFCLIMADICKFFHHSLGLQPLSSLFPMPIKSASGAKFLLASYLLSDILKSYLFLEYESKSFCRPLEHLISILLGFYDATSVQRPLLEGSTSLYLSSKVCKQVIIYVNIYHTIYQFWTLFSQSQAVALV